MVAPARAWSLIPARYRHFGPTAARLLVVTALLYPAFKLHDRAAEVEQRERSLRRTMEVVSRREKVNDDRERDLRALAVRLEHASQASKVNPPSKLVPVVADDGVRRAGFQVLESRLNVHPSTD